MCWQSFNWIWYVQKPCKWALAPGSHLLLPSCSKRALFAHIQRIENSCLSGSSHCGYHKLVCLIRKGPKRRLRQRLRLRRVWHNLLEWIETQIRYQVRFMYLFIHLFNSHLCSKYFSMHDGQHMWVSGIKQQEELPFWPRLRLYDNPDVSK